MKSGDVVAGRFTIDRPAGYGAMGAVYRAMDRLTGQPVALKVLHKEGSKRNVRFEREANLLAALRHPGVVRYVLHGATGAGAPFLAMEWVDGETLSDRIATEPLSVADSILVTTQLASALGEAHAHGVVHRDLKPGNVLLVEGDVARVKLIDFGIARRPESELTLTGVAIGSPGYMAPEQARGEKDIGPRADVFSLGCVLYRCLAGAPPFAGDDVRSVLAKILFEDPPLVEIAAPHVPPALARLVGRMLAKEPAVRPADGTSVVAELETLGAAGDGLPDGAPSGAPSITSEEQRLVSVVAAICPSEVAMTLDEPTTLSPTGTPLVDAVARTVAVFEARVERLADGTLVATLSGHGNAGDQAAQAARCALAMRAAAPRLAIVVATGRALLGSAALPTGDVIERAAKLLSVLDTRASGIIELDDVTAALLEGRFEVLRRGGRPALLRDLGPLEGSRTLLGKATPCVGREREIATLDAAFGETIGASAARVVRVTGPAGVGKSRLRTEFLARLGQRGEAAATWLARGDPITASAPFAMVNGALRRVLGVFEAAPPEEQRLRLADVLREALNPPDRRRVGEFLGALLGLPAPPDASAELLAARDDPALLGDQIKRAFVDFLAAKCAERPQIVLLEDAQWGDRPSMNLVDAALRELEFAPLLVVVIGRPPARDAFAGLFGGVRLEEMRLGPLTKRAAEELARAVLGPRARRDVVERVVDRAGGNAFYLEELLRAVSEGRGDELPDTVLAMVESRLERLDPDARHVLRAASVFGQVFWASAVHALLGGGHDRAAVAARLEQLEARELVATRDTSRFPGETELTFRHGLVRDAAYSTLTDDDRRLGHELAADWLRRAGERDAGIIAEHVQRGGDEEDAVAYYLLGAEQALEGGDLEAAVARAERGIGCGARGETLGALHLALAEAQSWRARTAAAEESAARATEALAPASARWYAAAALFSVSALRAAHPERVAHVGQQFGALPPSDVGAAARARAFAQVAADLLAAGLPRVAEPLYRELDQIVSRPVSDPGLRGAIDEARMTRALFAGDPGRFLVLARSAAASFDAAGDRRRACHARMRIGFASLELGQLEEAVHALQAAASAASALALPRVVATARAYLGLALGNLGQLEAAKAAEIDGMRAFAAQGDVRAEGLARAHLARLFDVAGDPAGALREARAASTALAAVPPAQSYALAVEARALVRRGDAAGALDAAARAVAILERLGGLEEGEAWVRLTHAEALAEAGHSPRAAVDAAAKRLRDRAGRIDFAELRGSFMERVPENRRTLELAASWADR